MPGTISPTIRPARAPITGAKTGWPASATTNSIFASPGAVERQGSHPQGAPLRADQQRRQSRRRRQGILLLSRQHADPFLHEVSVQVSAECVPLRRSASRPTGGAAAETWNTSCWIPASSTMTAISMFSSNTPRRRRRHPDPDHLCNRGPEPRIFMFCRRCCSAIPGPGGRMSRNRRCSKCAARRLTAVSASHEKLGECYLYCEGDVPLLFTENETNNSASSAAECTPYVKDAIQQLRCHGQTGAVNPESTGTKAAAHYQVEVGAGADRTIRLRLSDVAPDRIGDPFKKFAKIDGGRRRARPTSSIGDHHRRRLSSKKRPRDAPGAGRDAVDEAVLRPRCGQMAGGARRRSARRRPPGLFAIASGSTWSTTT